MNEINCKTFVLNNRLFADSAISKDENILSVDGVNCNFYQFDVCGSYSDCLPSTRAYRKLRYDNQSDSYTALSCCNRTVYCLDGCLNENTAITLDPAGECTCACSNPLSLTDASLTRIGNEIFIVGVYTHGAYLYDMNGKPLTQLCRADKNESLTDFIYYGEEKYAMISIKNNMRIVTVSENGSIKSGIVKPNMSIRMLFENDGDVFGLFGKNYIYNRMIPIYANNELTLPETINDCICTCGQ